MKAKISLITLGVTDLKRARAFYRDGLGFPTEGDTDNIVFLKLTGTWLALYPRDRLAEDAQVAAAGAGFPGFTLAHNVASKQEVDETLRFAEKAGARIVKPAGDVFWGGYSGYFCDPDGFLWEVAWNPHIDLT